MFFFCVKKYRIEEDPSLGTEVMVCLGTNHFERVEFQNQRKTKDWYRRKNRSRKIQVNSI